MATTSSTPMHKASLSLCLSLSLSLENTKQQLNFGQQPPLRLHPFIIQDMGHNVPNTGMYRIALPSRQQKMQPKCDAS
jgi:hypothetical protein